MDKFVKFYWKRTWWFNIFLTLIIVWGVVDSVRGKYSVSWLYFTMFIFLMFVLAVRYDIREKYDKERKLMREGLIA